MFPIVTYSQDLAAVLWMTWCWLVGCLLGYRETRILTHEWWEFELVSGQVYGAGLKIVKTTMLQTSNPTAGCATKDEAKVSDRELRSLFVKFNIYNNPL